MKLEKNWYAVFTKYKCEKYVRDQLNTLDIEAYVPIVEEVKKYKTKTRKIEKPLISNFVFVNIELKNYLKVLKVQYVRGFLKIANEMIAIPEREIEILKRIVGESIVQHESVGMIVGSTVEVIYGQLTGLKGVVVDLKGKKSFVVSLDTLELSFQIEVNPDYLKLID